MIKIRKSGVWTVVTTYKRRTGGVWVDVELGKRRDVGAGTWPIYYERILMTRPAEGTYAGMGVIQFANNGDVKTTGRYHDPITTVIGRWRKSGITPGVSDTIQIKVEKYLDQGDLEPGYYDSLNTWLTLVPGTSSYRWAANNGGAGKAVLKIILKDQAARELVFYAEIVYGGTGTIDYDPIDWSTGGGGGGGGGGGTGPEGPPVDEF